MGPWSEPYSVCEKWRNLNHISFQNFHYEAVVDPSENNGPMHVRVIEQGKEKEKGKGIHAREFLKKRGGSRLCHHAVRHRSPPFTTSLLYRWRLVIQGAPRGM